MRIVIFLIFNTLIFIGCGYKPTVEYTKNVLGDEIFVNVKTNINDPENTVLLKDAINEAVVSRFKSKLVPASKANSKLFIKLNKVKFEPIQYDKNGYIIAYKAFVYLDTKYIDKMGKSGMIQTKGEYDFPIESNSVISDSKRFEAIKFASFKALEEFISKISVRGLYGGNGK